MINEEDLRDLHKEWARKRRDKCIKRGVLELKLDASTIFAFLYIWESWVEVFGPDQAEHNLIEAMTEEQFLLVDRLKYKIGGKRGRIKLQRKHALDASTDDHSDDNDEA